jgi:pimeloyl-ACP methyl ester carboxylesterase
VSPSAHTVAFGHGPEVWLALHGWGGSWRTFEPLSHHLPDHVRLVCADLPGYGDTPAPEVWTHDAAAAPVLAVLDGLPPGPVHLLGNCSGAIFGLQAALCRPGRIDRCVLIDPFAFVPWYFRMFLTPGFGALAYHTAFANPLGRWMADQGLRNHRSAEGSLTASFTQVDHRAALGSLRLLVDLPDVTPFRPVGRHHRIVHGARTFQAVRESLGLWRANWPQVDVREVEGAGHLPLTEAPAACAGFIFRPFATPAPDEVAP